MIKRLLLSFLSGAALVLAFPPFGLGFLAWAAFIPLFFALEGTGKKRGFFLGFVFGAAFFLGTVYWVVHSMYFYGGVPFAAGVGVMLALVAYLSVYPAVFGLLVSVNGNTSPITRMILIPPLWVGLEFVRGHLFTGFPWVLLGYSQVKYLPVIQIADITGVWGLSFIIMLVNFALSLNVKSLLRGENEFPLKESLLALLMLSSTFFYGYLRIKQVDSDAARWRGMRVGIAQGSIDQSLKWDSSFRKETLEIYRVLTLDAGRKEARLIVWPETAIPFFFEPDAVRDGVGGILKESGSFVLTGSPSDNYNQAGRLNYFNSAYLLSPAGEAVGRYDKMHLVPFSEYVPLKKFLPFIHKLTEGVGDFVEGPGAIPIKFEGGGIGTLICYESIFPEIARLSVMNGATVLANITNDAWFGYTSAPYQHFEMAILRAVENRVYLLRAANTGISAVIDPVGRVRKKTALFERTAIIDDIRLKDNGVTFYTLRGDIFAYGCVILAGIFAATGLKRRSL